MLEARIDGSAALKAVASKIRAEGNKGLGREMSTALLQAARPVQASIRTEADKVMPSRGGYRAILSRSLKFRTSTRGAGRVASFRLLTYAEGTKERRDIRRLNLGELRHPVYGRSRRIRRGARAGTILRNPWSVTRITPGFHDRGTADAADAAEEEMLDVLADFAARLIE